MCLLEFRNGSSDLCGDTKTLENLRSLQNTLLGQPVVITVVEKREVVLRVHGAGDYSLKTILCAPNRSLVRDVLEEAASRS